MCSRKVDRGHRSTNERGPRKDQSQVVGKKSACSAVMDRLLISQLKLYHFTDGKGQFTPENSKASPATGVVCVNK